MHRFRVWAPKAERVRVGINGEKYPLGRSAGGWWDAEVESAEPGTDYAYFLDDEDMALPDPRSLWQPHGVHGASRVLDQGAFAWTDASWEAPSLASATTKGAIRSGVSRRLISRRFMFSGVAGIVANPHGNAGSLHLVE